MSGGYREPGREYVGQDRHTGSTCLKQTTMKSGDMLGGRVCGGRCRCHGRTGIQGVSVLVRTDTRGGPGRELTCWEAEFAGGGVDVKGVQETMAWVCWSGQTHGEDVSRKDDHEDR